MDLSVRELYGGAVTMALPAGMVDVSDFREVPSHQEVFTDDHDCSVIVEVLEAVEEQKHDALRYHFGQVADLNDAESAQQSRVEDIRLDAAGEAYVLVGQQDVAKFNEEAANRVCVLMALLRVPDHGADVLVTMNCPLAIDPKSSSSRSVPAGELQTNVDVLFARFKEMVRTLRIVDTGLFG
ncbi:hypothetical protein IWQ56_001498 [Coemansia nantahalensis]|nr:hypothetical protein IWQ56_001498 [Coemansia nantahalensis]